MEKAPSKAWINQAIIKKTEGKKKDENYKPKIMLKVAQKILKLKGKRT